MSRTNHTIVTGTIGEDVHGIGLRVLERALEDEGYDVVSLGVQTPQKEFFDAAIETDASCIAVSSLSGHAVELCEGFRNIAIEYGLTQILLYLGGNLSVSNMSEEEVKHLFRGEKYGFDRVFTTGSSIRSILDVLQEDLRSLERRSS